MMIRHIAMLSIGCVLVLAAPGWAGLHWQQNGSPLEELVIDQGESVTVQLYNDDPIARYYHVSAGNDASAAARIADVLPLFLAGDLAYAQASTPDWYLLHCEWDPGNPQPISVWGDHWDVTIAGIAPGSETIFSGIPSTHSDLSVTVTPEPATLILLAPCLLIMVARRQAFM
jgi:hypothetical protein